MNNQDNGQRMTCQGEVLRDCHTKCGFSSQTRQGQMARGFEKAQDLFVALAKHIESRDHPAQHRDFAEASAASQVLVHATTAARLPDKNRRDAKTAESRALQR